MLSLYEPFDTVSNCSTSLNVNVSSFPHRFCPGVFAHVLVSDLCGADDRLPGRVAPPNHHLLGNEDFLRGDLYPQVTPGNHHTITLSQDLFKTDRQIRARRRIEWEGMRHSKKQNKKHTNRGMRTQSIENATLMPFVSVRYTAGFCKRLLNCDLNPKLPGQNPNPYVRNVNEEQQEAELLAQIKKIIAAADFKQGFSCKHHNCVKSDLYNPIEKMQFLQNDS